MWGKIQGVMSIIWIQHNFLHMISLNFDLTFAHLTSVLFLSPIFIQIWKDFFEGADIIFPTVEKRNFHAKG